MALRATSSCLLASVLALALCGCGSPTPPPATAAVAPPPVEPGKGRPAKEDISKFADQPGGMGRAMMPGGGPTKK